MEKVVVLIFTHRAEPDEFERLSFQQCFKVLGKHPIRLVCPRGMDVSAYRAMAPNLVVDSVPPRFMASLKAYNRLKMAPWFYRRYSNYEFMLTYELDAFVFRDELLEWCDKGWHFIGAPWFEGFNQAVAGAPYSGAGNSGFSLRHVASVLKIVTTWRKVTAKKMLWKRCVETRRHILRQVQLFCELVTFNNYHYPLCPKVLEDYFFCIHAAKAFPEFRVAPVKEASRFSIENFPGRVFADGGNKLPFGCHAWRRHGSEFWAPFIRESGYSI